MFCEYLWSPKIMQNIMSDFYCISMNMHICTHIPISLTNVEWYSLVSLMYCIFKPIRNLCFMYYQLITESQMPLVCHSLSWIISSAQMFRSCYVSAQFTYPFIYNQLYSYSNCQITAKATAETVYRPSTMNQVPGTS